MRATGPQRISVVGSTGSGKTTVAVEIGRRLGIPVIELDALHWGPDWTPADRETVRERVSDAIGGPAWVVDGNYRSMVQDLVWDAADTIVWLDLPFLRNAAQLLRRTGRRLLRRERLWHGNRETLRGAVLSRDSILLWLAKTHRGNRERYEADMAPGAHPGLGFVRLRNRREIDAWLERLG